MKAFLRRLAAISAIVLPLAAQAAHPFAGSYYAVSSTTVDQYATDGTFIRTIAQADASGEPRGLAKGPGGMYLVRFNVFTPSLVQVLDRHGVVTKTYAFDGWIGGTVASGNVHFSPRKDYFYVAAQEGVYRFPVNGSAGTLFIKPRPGESVSDVAILPNGDLLVAAIYTLSHYTAEGQRIKTFDHMVDPLHLAPPDAMLYDMKGVVYDAATDTTFVSILGTTAFFYQVLAFEGISTVLKGITSADDPAGLNVTPEGTLLVGNSLRRPGIFSFTNTKPMTLTQVGSLPTDGATFVTSTRPAKVGPTQ